MKFKLFRALSTLLMVFTLFSCTKDETTAEVNTNVNLRAKRNYKDDLNGTTLFYDAQNRLVKKESMTNGAVSSSIVYNYDSVGNLESYTEIASNGFSSKATYTYSKDNKIMSYIYDSLTNQVLQSRTKYEYTYGVTTQISSTNWDLLNNKWDDTTKQTVIFEFDAKGRLVKKTSLSFYFTYGYDDNDNVTVKIEYNKKLGSDQFYMKIKTIRTYDNQKNPIYNVFPTAKVLDYYNENGLGKTKNNETSYSQTCYNEDGTENVAFARNSSSVYEYNNAGFPTKITKSEKGKNDVLYFSYENY